jgi:hypothetical protein
LSCRPAEPQIETQRSVKAGGADRIRTCDLLIANETLYQLSYDPSLAVQTRTALPENVARRNREVNLPAN